MNRTLASVFVAWSMVAAIAHADETWLQKVLRVSGITAAPAPRASADTQAGSVWVVPVAGGAPVRWTGVDAFVSPVFDADGETLYALRGDELVRIAAPNAAPQVIRKLTGVEKLVGFDAQVPTDLVLLMRDQKAPVAVWSTASPSLTRVPVDLTVLEQQRLVANLRAQNRTVGALRVVVDQLDKESLAGAVEWTDVFAEDGTGPRRNLSRCDGTNCAQPAISPDRTRVAYVRSER